MLLNEKIDIKLFYRFIEFVSRLLGGSLPHERYKLIALDEYQAQSKDENDVKRFSEAYLYLLNNVNQVLTLDIIKQSYYLLTKEELGKNIGKLILETYYKNFDDISHYLATIIHFTVLDNVKTRKFEFAFMLSNLIMLKKDRFPLVPYEYMYNAYFRAAKNKSIDKLMILFSEIESINKPHKKFNQLDLSTIVDNLKKEREFLKNRFGIQKLYIYGSYAKCKTTVQSDLDLLVIFNYDLINIERNNNREELINYLSNELKMNVDLLDFTHALENLDICEMENIITII